MFTSLLFALAITLSAAADPFFLTDSMTDQELRRYRNARVLELQKRAVESSPERTPEGKVFRMFFCTLYYTPNESGYTAERGFDITPVAAPGTGGHKYPRSFLDAVKKEGFGRLAAAVKGRSYLRYAGDGRYAFAREPLGNRGNVLIPRKSCAISSRNPYLRQGRIMRIESPAVEAVMGTQEWLTADTGGGVHPLQIDLYWGDDDPLGAIGRQRARPAGTRMEYAFDVVVTVKD